MQTILGLTNNSSISRISLPITVAKQQIFTGVSVTENISAFIITTKCDLPNNVLKLFNISSKQHQLVN